MSQFLIGTNATQSHDGKDYRADANGVVTVLDELDSVFRNVYGHPSWFPASAKDAQMATAIPEQNHDHEAEA
jgi:hypothetical protein